MARITFSLDRHQKLYKKTTNSLNVTYTLTNFIFSEKSWINLSKTKANTNLAYSDLALDKFSGTAADQDAESCVHLKGRKINFALGDEPGDADD